MKHFSRILFFFLGFTSVAFAQTPTNDDCVNAINLLVVDVCQTETFYTNLNATASNIGTRNSPTCFVGGNTQRDVWFRFTTTADIQNHVITVQGKARNSSTRKMVNPQMTLYRGACNALSELRCISAPNGSDRVEINISNLPANQTFYLRINDYSATTTPNWGDFTICIEEFAPEINIGSVPSSTACKGTLYDSGGPNENYGNSENATFTVCPESPNQCIIIEVEQYDLELNFDVLSMYSGETVNAPLLARISGANFGTPFPIQTSSDCVTFRFVSDFVTRRPGFKLTWQCATELCFPTSLDRPTVVTSLPFNASLTTCGVPASFAQTPCGTDIFLNGPEHVLTYESPGDVCVNVTVENAADNTGILILDGLPSDPNTTCVAESATGRILAADLRRQTKYYIVVAQPIGCTGFDIKIEQSDCILSPALRDALCNPLNGCINERNVPSQFIFRDGFKDIELVENVNSGCWENEGDDADFFWFTIEAQANGKFGFILRSADIPSDIDFNVWGPFTQEQACSDPQSVIRFIENNQPIRSSWSPLEGPTGMTDRHPLFRYRINDDFDCGSPNLPSPLGDDYVRPIDVQEGEVYVVLVNDFGDEIIGNGILVDWSPSTPAILNRLPVQVVTQNAEICQGDSVRLEISSGIDNVKWVPSEGLSCSDCLTPMASPTETTVYLAIVEGVCTLDTVKVEVKVKGVNLDQEITVCAGEKIELSAGSDFQSATYQWIAPPGINLSCTDCPNPTAEANIPGVYEIIVNLQTEECPATDKIIITVLGTPAPQFDVLTDTTICIGASLALGRSTNNSSLIYTWTGVPDSLKNVPNPTVTPTVTTTYFVSVSNGICPLISTDSVTVEVSTEPNIAVTTDTTLCQGSPLQMSFSTPEPNTRYQWQGPSGANFANDTIVNTLATPQNSGTYRLTATRGACEVIGEVVVEVIEIGLALMPDTNMINVCKGLDTILRVDPTITRPLGVLPRWFPNNGTLSDTVGLEVTLTPRNRTTYYVEIENRGCKLVDSVLVTVDSLPINLAIMPSDTMVCEGSYVRLLSETYEPFEFPAIDFTWEPSNGQQTPDSLYNLIVTPDTTIIYKRITTNGACIQVDSAIVNVNPLPEVIIRPENPVICGGQSVQLDVISTNNVTVESYMWMPMQGLSCTDCKTPLASQLGNYNVQVMSDKGCPGGAAVSIQVIPSPIFQLPSQTIYCQGDSVQLNDAFSPEATYTWTSTDPNFGTRTEPILSVVPPLGITTYRLVASNGSCPPISREITITVLGDASFSITGDTDYCEGENAILSFNANTNGNLVWTKNIDPNFSASSFDIAVRDSVTTTYTATFEYACGTVVRTVTVNPKAAIEIEEVRIFNTQNIEVDTIVEGTTVTLEAILESALGNATISWIANGAATGSNSLEIEDSDTAPGRKSYTVTVTTPDGCRRTRRIDLVILPATFQTPNLFTPNGDENNDIFRVIYSQGVEVETFELKVYSRWGNLVYETGDIDAGWDGTKDGEPMPSDVYVYYYTYKIRGQSDTNAVKGNITLLR